MQEILSVFNEDCHPPADLLEKVMRRIGIEQLIASAKRKFWLCAGVLILFLIISVPVWRAFSAEAAESGFGDYAALVWSDFGTVSASWQDFGLSLTESFPIVGAMELLIIAFALFVFARLAVKNVSLIQTIN